MKFLTLISSESSLYNKKIFFKINKESFPLITKKISSFLDIYLSSYNNFKLFLHGCNIWQKRFKKTCHNYSSEPQKNFKTTNFLLIHSQVSWYWQRQTELVPVRVLDTIWLTILNSLLVPELYTIYRTNGRPDQIRPTILQTQLKQMHQELVSILLTLGARFQISSLHQKLESIRLYASDTFNRVVQYPEYTNYLIIIS